jgi:hypothetical protein
MDMLHDEVGFHFDVRNPSIVEQGFIDFPSLIVDASLMSGAIYLGFSC